MISQNKNNFELQMYKLKKEIVKLLHKNPELYCDCKKEIFNFDSFEELAVKPVTGHLACCAIPKATANKPVNKITFFILTNIKD